MSFIVSYDKTDVFRGNNNIEKNGFPKDKTLGQMLDIAIQHRCPIIIKAGKNAKWYLKGSGKSATEIVNALEEKKGKYRDGMIAYYIKF